MTKNKTEENKTAGTIVLNNPIMIDGASKSKFEYDMNEISCELYAAAEEHRVSNAVKSRSMVELDNTMQLYLGFAAIIAKNPDLDWKDLERIKGLDLRKVQMIGRDFFTASGNSNPEHSEEQSETTEELSK